MSRIVIVKDDNNVGIDGEFRHFDLSNLEPGLHAVVYDTVKQKGWIEYDAQEVKRRPNKEIDEVYFTNAFGSCVDIWNSLTPQPEPPHIQTPEEIKASFINAVQGHIDTVAMSRGYDSGVSLASYATDTHPSFAAEANAFIPWRSSVWLYCYQEWAKVEAGQRQVTTAAAFINELPVIVWP